MKEYLLGIDIGTSSCKTALFDTEGNVAGIASQAYETLRPYPGWAEQRSDDWWEGACRGIRKLLNQAGIQAGQIRGVGIDGQSWAPVFLDGQGKVLANSPIWMDTRAKEVCRRVNEKLGDTLFQVSGNPFEATYITPKVLWARENWPEVYEKTQVVLQTNSYLVWKLTGELSQDLSQGYGWHCFDMRQMKWDYDTADLLDIPRHFLPPLYPCHQVVGQVTDQAARESGLAVGTPVIAGGVDAACATLGAGVYLEGQAQEQGGQAGGISICTGQYKADPRLIISPHVLPNLWLLQGGATGGSGILRWVEQEFGDYERLQAQNQELSSFDLLTQLAEKAPAGSEGLVFLPYMSGERTPIWNPNAKGVFFGLDFSKTKAHFVRAALEGVGFSLRHMIEAAEETGCQIQSLRASGGSANSLLWTQIKADITGKEFQVASSDLTTVLGTIMITGYGTGIWPDMGKTVDKLVQVRRVHKPQTQYAELYRKQFEVYKQLYLDLKELMG